MKFPFEMGPSYRGRCEFSGVVHDDYCWEGLGLLAAYPTKSRLPASHNHRRCQWPRVCALMGFRRKEDPPGWTVTLLRSAIKMELWGPYQWPSQWVSLFFFHPKLLSLMYVISAIVVDWWFWIGGLDAWDSLMKGSVTQRYPQKPKPPIHQ